MSIARTLYDIFYEGCTHYATGYVNGDGKAAYAPHEGIPTLDLIEQHLNGEIVLGAYTLLPGNDVRWCAWDVDSKNGIEKARELALKILELLGDLPHAVEFSGNKGYHIWAFFPDKEQGKRVKSMGDKIQEILGLPKKGDPHVEFFPKQGELTPENPRGNLLRLPLGFHPTTKKPALFVNSKEWEEGKALDPENSFSKITTLESLEALIVDQDPLDEMVAILTPYWESGQRHDISLYVSGFLANQGITEEAASDLITKIHAQVPEGDLKDQLKTVATTFKRFYAGEKIVGFTGLDAILPGSVLKRLVEISGKQTSSVALQLIDRIRLDKGPIFLKVRSSATTVTSHFKEHGKLVRDASDTYWLNYASRKLIMVDGRSWDRLLHNQFGLNLSESFGRQVAESIKHYAYDQSKEVQTAKRSYWNGDQLLMNLGGPEIYTLGGDPGSRKVSLNGEEEILFVNADDTLFVPNLKDLDVSPMSPWPFLTNDVNFKTGDNIDATPTQQRELLKAFITSIFFSQAMPTRPILAILADPGAGKTTTARRILRFLEGPTQDVLGVIFDKPDSFRASLSAHKVLALDNLEETKAAWLTDMLNRASTGAHIELRELHTTNKTRKIIPDCYIIITATQMPFSKETVYSRFLPIQLDKITNYRPERQIEIDLITNFNAMWLGMMDDLDKVVAQLNMVKSVDMPNETRLADFSVFCHRIKDADFLVGKDLIDGLGNLVNRQKQMLEENSPLIETIQIWVRGRSEDSTKWMNISEVFSHLQKTAALNRVDWRWSTAQGLSKHMGVLETELIKNHGMSVRPNKENGRDVKQYKFSKQPLVM